MECCDAKRTRFVVALFDWVARRIAVLIRYPALRPCWITLGWCCWYLCAALMAALFLLVLSFLAMAVRSSSASVMLLSKNRLSAAARSRNVLRTWALRRCLLVGLAGGATVMSSSSCCGGSGLSCSLTMEVFNIS